MSDDSKLRSGRVLITATNTKTIIIGGFGSRTSAVYRIFNSGKDGEDVTVIYGPGANDTHTLGFRDSVDVVVSNHNISVTAGASKDANIVYDMVGPIAI